MEEGTTTLLTALRATVHLEILRALLRQSTGLEGDELLDCVDEYVESVTKMLHA